MRDSRLVWLLGTLMTASFTLTAGASVVEWVPVSASGTHAIDGNTILLQGGGQTVTLHFIVSDWDPDATGVTVGSFQGTVEPTGYLGANAIPPRPGVDLAPLGYPLSPTDGAFQALKVCSDDFVPPLFETFDPLSNCQSNGDCATGFVCVERPDYVYFGLDNVPTVTNNTLAYSWSSATPPPDCPGTDRTTKYYGGTLILDVPVGAIGTYTVGFVDDSNFTLINNCSGELLPGLIAIPVQITVACTTGQDCDDNNECTDDVCEVDQTCTNTLNYDEAVDCCNPQIGPPTGLTEIDDQNECTLDVCNPEDGSVSRSPLTGADCGGPPTPGDPCDVQNTCNSLAECVDNSALSGIACGNQVPTDPECDSPDSCDGAGLCLPNNEPIGTECGDPVPTQCDDADSCDGAGSCRPNNLPIGTPCDDDQFCTVDEQCSGGTCGNGQFTCDDGVGCTDDSCDEFNDLCDNVPDDTFCNNSQWCDGEEICDADLDCVTLPGSVPDCDDFVGCTDDSCDEINDVCVSNANDGNCNNGQFCDGVERCDAVDDCYVVNGSIPDCDDAVDCTDDGCDEANDRCTNNPNDNLCADDGLYCTGPEVCDADTGCQSAGCPCGGDCEITCDETSDSCLCDPPIAEAAGGRYLKITLQPPDALLPQAMVITPSCPEGITHYVGAPQPFDIDDDGIFDGTVARVVDDPADAAWLTPAEWGDPVYVTGIHVVPATEFTINGDCGAPGDPSFSEPATATTWGWGDVRHDNYLNVADVQYILFGMQGRYEINEFLDPPFYVPSLDLWGGGVGFEGMCTPNQLINVSDLQQDRLAFQGVPFTNVGCPIDCPACIAEFTCNDNSKCTTDSCNIDGSCSHVDNYDDELYCCAPSTGSLTDIEDGDACTIDTCNPGTGDVSHVPIECADSSDCTVDECVDGACVFTDYQDLYCADNRDCPDNSAGCAGRCTCPGTPAVLMEWRPISASVPFEVEGNEILIPAGVAEVTFELYLSNWSPELVGAYQGSILSSSYSTGTAGMLTPVTTPIPCETVSDCIGDGTTNRCSGGFCEWTEGAFIDVFRSDWVYAGSEWPDVIYVLNTVTLDYLWAVAAYAGYAAEDPGVPAYCATLVLYVSHDARGTFTLTIDPDINRTIVNSAPGVPIRPVTLKPGLITITED